MFFNIKNNIKFSKYHTNTLWMFLEKTIRIFFELSIGAWMARYLGPKDFGLLNYAYSYAIIMGTLANLGLDGILVKELVNHPAQRNGILGTAFILKFVTSIFLFSLFVIIISIFNPDTYSNLIIVIVCSAIIFNSFKIIDIYFQAIVNTKPIVAINIYILIVSNLIKIFLIVFQAPLFTFALSFLLDNILTSLGYIYVFYDKTKTNFLKILTFKLKKAIKLLKYSWPLIFSGLATVIYMRIDQIMIQTLLDSKSVGYYSAAIKLSEGWYFIPMIISTSFFPAIINAKNNNNFLYKKRIQSLFDLLIIISIILAISITSLSNSIINFFYGNEFAEAATVLRIHIWTTIFVFIGVISSKWFIVENLQKYSLYRTLSGAVINVVLNYLLIPSYGIIGAAVATLIAQFSASYFFNLFSYKTRSLFIMQTKSLFLINFFNRVFKL